MRRLRLAEGSGKWRHALQAAMIPLDTLRHAKRLESAGVPARQAEAHAMALSDIVVTQAVGIADLIALQERLKLYLKAQLAQFMAELKWTW